MEIIQSKQNASIKTARKLLQGKHRKTSYLLEGWHLFEEAKASGAEILQVFVLEEMADRVVDVSKVKLVDFREISLFGRCAGSWKCWNNDSYSRCSGL